MKRLTVKVAVLVGLMFGFGGCTKKPVEAPQPIKKFVVNMDLQNISTVKGNLNSSDLEFGSLYVWDKYNKALNHLKKITDVNNTDISSKRNAISSISNTDSLEVSGSVRLTKDEEAIALNAKKEFIKANSIKLNNYSVKKFLNYESVLNSSEEIKRLVKQSYTNSKQYQFIFIGYVLEGDEVEIVVDKNNLISSDGKILTYVGYEFKLNYNEKLLEALEGKDIPLMVKPAIFKFRNGKFYRDNATKLDLQKVTIN